MVLATLFYWYQEYLMRRLHRIWPNHFSNSSGASVLPGLVLKRMPASHAPAEAEALRYIRQHTTIPVPRVYASAKGYGRSYILMEKIKGTTLAYAWKTLSDQQRDAIVSQLQDYLAQLRTLPSPYGRKVCGANGGSLWDGRITCTKLVGPFEDEASFNDFIVKWSEMFLVPSDLAAIRRRMRDDHRIVFTHGDLAPRNIVVHDGRISGLVDWGDAGWYPEYWELVKVMWFPDIDKAWSARVLRLFSEEDKKDWMIDREMSDRFVGVF